MENRVISSVSPKKIALIIPWFGPLPPYFPVWLESAKANPDVDFLFYTDQKAQIDAPNFRVHRLSLDDLRRRFERILNRSLQIPNGYKLCDYRPSFGLLFEDELRGYDFWGHCDIDLVFGQIRRFLTDEILSAYDRFYAYGPLSVYRNSANMRRAFELPGSLFTLDETFGPIHVGADEFPGMNRICLENNIPWYSVADFADLNNFLPERIEMTHGRPNYPVQAFCWTDGRAFQRYLDRDVIRETDVLYIHWFKKRPVPERVPAPGEVVVITPDKLLVRSPEDLTPENMRLWNPPLDGPRRLLAKGKAYAKEYSPLFTGDSASRKILWKRKAFAFLEMKLKKPPYP